MTSFSHNDGSDSGGDGRAGGIPARGREIADRQAAAAYIATMAGELLAMANQAGLPHLCYFLDMARTEALASGARAAASPGEHG